jgi:competence protein ComEC
MIGVAVSFLSGIAAFFFFPYFPLSIISLCILAIVVSLLLRNIHSRTIILFILVFATGFFYTLLRHPDFPEASPHDSLPSALTGTDVFLEGTVVNVPELVRGKIRLDLDRINIQGNRIQGIFRLFVKESLVQKSLSNSLPYYGDRTRVLARLKPPSVLQNPGVYSYDAGKDGIIAVGYVKQFEAVGREWGVLRWINTLRRRMGNIIDKSLSPDSASLHRAIIPGLKRGVSGDMRDTFSSTGLAHLLSISGTHFGLLAFLIFQSMKRSMKLLPVRFFTEMTLYITPTQAAVLITLPVLTLYALISGASTPTIRALIMVFIYMLALFMGRKNQWLNSLSIAALVILLWQPHTLFELSFQLSFLAVLSIGYVLDATSRRRNPDASLEVSKGVHGKILSWFIERVKTGFVITTSAVLGTAPIVALVFKQFPLISPVTNLLLTPLICFIILPLGFVTGFGALLFNLQSMPLSGITDTLTYFSLKLIQIFSLVPYASFRVHTPSFMIIIAYYAALYFIVKGRTAWRFIALIIVVSFYWLSPYLFKGDGLRITFLDVSQGDSSVIELPDKRTMIIDGGTREPGMGRMVVAPYLWSRGTSEIDVMVLSHPHPDHFGGLLYIVDHFRVGEVWFNGRITYEAEDFMQKIREKKIPLRILKRGDLIEAKGYRIHVFHPYDEFYAGSVRGGFSDENSDSLVLQLETNGVSVLFTGDIEIEAEDDLVHIGDRLQSNILKVPHHGGRTSSSIEFLRAVSPDVAVVSAGKNNRFHHPHRETIDRYRDAGVVFYRTDRDGAVSIVIGENSKRPYEINTYLESRLEKVQTIGEEIRNIKSLFVTY